jgi:hypothetical protein
MNMTRTAFLTAAQAAVTLLSDPAVAASWDEPSSLAELKVSGLAGHLARQILTVPRVLAQDMPAEDPVSLVDHYSRVRWRDAGLDDEANVSIQPGRARARDHRRVLTTHRRWRSRAPAECRTSRRRTGRK